MSFLQVTRSMTTSINKRMTPPSPAQYRLVAFRANVLTQTTPLDFLKTTVTSRHEHDRDRGTEAQPQ